MIPVTLNFQCRTNSDYVEEFTVKDGAQPVDLTGFTVQQVVKTNVDGTEVFTLDTVEEGVEGWQVLENGTLIVTCSAETLSNAFDSVAESIAAGVTVHFVHDIKVTHSDGLEEIWAVGNLSVTKGIS